MNEHLQETIRWGIVAAPFAAFYLACCYLQIRRRDVWLTLLDSDESFCARFCIPRVGWFRRFGESRIFVGVNVCFGVLFLVETMAFVCLYFQAPH
jgi:hypothetical protein